MAYVARRTLFHARELRRQLTTAERILWARLRRNAQGLHFRRQHPIGPYIADFACIAASLIVEVDGATHGADAERCYDERRDAFMRSLGWCVLRVANCDVYESLDGVMEFVCQTAAARAQERASSVHG